MPICDHWVDVTNKAAIINLGASKGIVITNVLFRFFIIWIMKYSGAKTETNLAYYITMGIFFTTTLNTGWLIMLSNANLS